MKLTREIKTAILVIASILLFIWGYSFLKGRDLFTNYKTFYVEYDNVEDLAQSAPVTLNGLGVGKVNKITINENTGRLLVELQMKTDFPISKTSTAALYSPSLIGGKQIKIIPNLTDKELAVDGQTLAPAVELGLTESLGGKIPSAKIDEIIDESSIYSFQFLDWKKKFELKKQWLAHTKKVCLRCDLPLHKKYTGKKKRRSFFCTNCQNLYE